MVRLAEIRLRCPRCGAAIERRSENQFVCVACAAVFPVQNGIPSLMPEAQKRDQVRHFFDRVADQLHDGKLSYVPVKAPRLDAQLRILSRAFGRVLDRWVSPGSLVLDVGCGHGALLERVASRYQMVGIDFVGEMLPFARKRGYAVYQGDAAALPFEGGQFDAVICAEVLQHFPDPTKILAELARVCRPGGAVVISTLNRHSLARSVARVLTALLRRRSFPIPFVRRSPGDILRLVAGMSLKFDEVAWILSPSHAVVFTRKTQSIVSPLATNFILRLEKTD